MTTVRDLLQRGDEAHLMQFAHGIIMSKIRYDPKLNMEEFAEAILELRNTPGVDGHSPNEIVFGTNLRSRVPFHHTAFDERWKKAADEADLKRSQIHEKA